MKNALKGGSRRKDGRREEGRKRKQKTARGSWVGTVKGGKEKVTVPQVSWAKVWKGQEVDRHADSPLGPGKPGVPVPLPPLYRAAHHTGRTGRTGAEEKPP